MNRRRTISVERRSSPGDVAHWVLLALLLSLLLHGLFWMWANKVRMDRFSDEFYDKIVPRTFHLERVEIDPKLLEPVPDPGKTAVPPPTAVRLPDEKISFEKLMDKSAGERAAPKTDPALLNEIPAMPPPSFQNTMQNAQAAGAIPPGDKAFVEELLRDNPPVLGTSVLDLPDPQHPGGSDVAGSGDRGGNSPDGFSNLDALLARTGPLTPETAPILMPTDLLFDYDSAALRPEALASLGKLGLLIHRNPSMHFLIEGHTDSFGSDDYNMDLSRRRAESVKVWLTSTMGLPPESIQATGLGKTRLIASADRSVEEQQINRRVEIVIRTPDATIP